MDTNRVNNQLMDIAFRIREMRDICGFSVEEMAAHIDALRGEVTQTASQEDILARFESGDLEVDEMLDYFKEDDLL